MRAALKLGQAPLGMVVAVGLHAAGVVERNALIIAQRRPAGALVVVLVMRSAQTPERSTCANKGAWSRRRMPRAYRVMQPSIQSKHEAD